MKKCLLDRMFVTNAVISVVNQAEVLGLVRDPFVFLKGCDP
jgi:hypothetical protein